MPNERREGLDRRDFMMAAIGLVGASASLASGAQDTKAPPVGPASGVPQRTVYTGDVIQGKKVISALDVKDLERGRSTRSILRVGKCLRGNTGMCRC